MGLVSFLFFFSVGSLHIMTIFPQTVSYLYSLDTTNWLVRSSCINEMGPDSSPPALGLVAGYLEK